MKCKFCIEEPERVDEEKLWDRLTNNATFPDVIEMDIDCIPNVGDDIEFDLTFGRKIVELNGKVERRYLVDARDYVNLRDDSKVVYWWFNVSNVSFCWLDTIYEENIQQV